MKTLLLRALVAAATLAALPAVVRAQSEPACGDKAKYHFAGGEVSIPFHRFSGGLLFQVHIKGMARPLLFSLDTGAARTYVDKKVAVELGMVPTGETTVQGAGRERLHVKQVDNVGFTLPGLESTGHLVNLASLGDLSNDSPDGKLDGFFGSDFIERFAITIDYANNRLIVADACKFDYHGRGSILPVSFRGKLPFVSGTIEMSGQPPQTSQYLVDTGSGDAVDDPAILKSKGPVRKIKTGVGLGEGTAGGVIGHLDAFVLGGNRMPRPLTACCGPVEDWRHMFGTEVLRRFKVTLDYQRKHIIVEPNEHLRDPFPDA